MASGLSEIQTATALSGQQLEFVLENESAINDYALFSKMRGIRRQERRKKAGDRKAWEEYAFSTAIGRDIFITIEQFLPYSLPFWRHFAAVCIEIMEKHGFEYQPSVNMKDDGKVDRLKGYAMFTMYENRDIRRDNELLQHVTLSQHILNVTMAGRFYLEGSGGAALTLEDKRLVIMGCLLHDIGKLLPLCAHFGIIASDDDIAGLSRIGHAKASGMIIEEMFKSHFADRAEYDIYRPEIMRLKSMCIEHHSEKKFQKITPHLNHCDRSARKAELVQLQKMEEKDIA